VVQPWLSTGPTIHLTGFFFLHRQYRRGVVGLDVSSPLSSHTPCKKVRRIIVGQQGLLAVALALRTLCIRIHISLDMPILEKICFTTLQMYVSEYIYTKNSGRWLHYAMGPNHLCIPGSLSKSWPPKSQVWANPSQNKYSSVLPPEDSWWLMLLFAVKLKLNLHYWFGHPHPRAT